MREPSGRDHRRVVQVDDAEPLLAQDATQLDDVHRQPRQLAREQEPAATAIRARPDVRERGDASLVHRRAGLAEQLRCAPGWAKDVRLEPVEVEVRDHERKTCWRAAGLAAVMHVEDAGDRGVRHVPRARLTFGSVARPLRVHLSVPAYWPAHSFGGPIAVMMQLAEGLAERGHTVEVFTTSLTSHDARGSTRTRVEDVHGVRVHYVATPLHFRWMGLTPTLPLRLERLPRPDVVHVFGFRDPIGTGVATWCRIRKVPYVFEGLGMVAPKHRKVLLKRTLDSTVYRGVLGGATRLVAASGVEAREYRAAGIAERRIVVRPHGFPDVFREGGRGTLRERIAVGEDTPLVVYVGRIAHGKGLELLVQVAAQLPGVHVAIVGPDGGHGVRGELLSLRDRLRVADRVHLVGPLDRSALPSV